MIEELIEKMKGFADFSIPGNIHEFERVLSDLALLKDPNIIPPLIPFLKDDCKFPEVIFSIVHTIEIFSDKTYIEKLLPSLPQAWNLSPYWTSVLHYRIFNSEPTFKEYLEQIRNSPSSVKNTIKSIVENINSQTSKFSEQCANVLKQL